MYVVKVIAFWFIYMYGFTFNGFNFNCSMLRTLKNGRKKNFTSTDLIQNVYSHFFIGYWDNYICNLLSLNLPIIINEKCIWMNFLLSNYLKVFQFIYNIINTIILYSIYWKKKIDASVVCKMIDKIKKIKQKKKYEWIEYLIC